MCLVWDFGTLTTEGLGCSLLMRFIFKKHKQGERRHLACCHVATLSGNTCGWNLRPLEPHYLNYEFGNEKQS